MTYFHSPYLSTSLFSLFLPLFILLSLSLSLPPPCLPHKPEASVSGQETSKEVDGQESSLGEASQGEAASLEEASQGEASQGEASQVSQEELSQGEAEVSHEEEDAGTWEKAGKKVSLLFFFGS